MHIIYQSFHIREFLIRHNRMIFSTAFSLPSIIYVNICITIIYQTGFNHCIRHSTYLGIINIIPKNIPGTKPHRGSKSQFISNFQRKFLSILPITVFSDNVNQVSPFFFSCSGNNTCLRINRQSIRQIPGFHIQRSCPGYRYCK